MQLTSTLEHPLLTTAKVIIDWTNRLLPADDAAQGDIDVEELIQWVKTHPRRSNIHVYLRSDLRSGRTRRLQRSLQTLGCTVIAKTGIASGYTLPALSHIAAREWQ